MGKEKIAKVVILDDYSQTPNFGSNTIIITATQNLKSNKLFDAPMVVSFSELINLAYKDIDNKKTINSPEFRYIINKEISKLFDADKARSYQNCINELEDLFLKLLLNNIGIEKIQGIDFDNLYSSTEKEIFEIYKNIYKRLREPCQLSKLSLINQAGKMVSNYDVVVFIGFVFFNELQEAFIKNIKNTAIAFINKPGDFIQEELLYPLLKEMNFTIETQRIIKKEKCVFDDIEDKLFTNQCIDVGDSELVKFNKPFSNREDEFLFIAKEISNHLSKRKLSVGEIDSAVQEYAVILTKNKNELSKILNDAFGEYGIFVPSTKLCYRNLKPIYYSKQEFLSEKIFDNEKQLGYLEKLKLFENFKRINVSGINLQSSDFPIGKFILEVYRVVASDLDLEKFKNLININWYLNKVADSDSIEDFYRLQPYFERLTKITEWKQTIDELITLKAQIMRENEFGLHPLYVVKQNSLNYIKDYLDFLDELIKKLKVDGTIRKQVEILIQNFGLKNVTLPTQEEQETLSLFVNILNNIESNDEIEIDFKYFAEHIKELIDQYANVQQQNKKSFRLAVVNMENYSKYDYVYFPMFEEDKYPRIVKSEFPYTTAIKEILINDLGMHIQKNLDLNYHLKMSRHIFKNVFGFTRKSISFTFTSKENGTNLDISVYAKDIARVIKRDIELDNRNVPKVRDIYKSRTLEFKSIDIKELSVNQLLSKFLCQKQFCYSVILGNKICYSNIFLLNFYAKALIINRFFVELASTNKEYILSDQLFQEEINSIFYRTYNIIMKYFSLFSENEKKDIKITAKKYINDFIEIHFKSGKFAAKRCRFYLGKEKIIKDRIIVRSRRTLIMFNTTKNIETEFDISKMLDFPITRCGGKRYNLEHFAEITDKLNYGNRFDDKMDLVNFASFKINTQLNNKRFYQDGVERIRNLLANFSLEYSNAGETISSYCRFCKLKNICKGVLIDD